jgi:hypothetical protein
MRQARVFVDWHISTSSLSFVCALCVYPPPGSFAHLFQLLFGDWEWVVCESRLCIVPVPSVDTIKSHLKKNPSLAYAVQT